MSKKLSLEIFDRLPDKIKKNFKLRVNPYEKSRTYESLPFCSDEWVAKIIVNTYSNLSKETIFVTYKRDGVMIGYKVYKAKSIIFTEQELVKILNENGTSETLTGDSAVDTHPVTCNFIFINVADDVEQKAAKKMAVKNKRKKQPKKKKTNRNSGGKNGIRKGQNGRGRRNGGGCGF